MLKQKPNSLEQRRSAFVQSISGKNSGYSLLPNGRSFHGPRATGYWLLDKTWRPELVLFIVPDFAFSYHSQVRLAPLNWRRGFGAGC
jgi:hypothetical protein